MIASLSDAMAEIGRLAGEAKNFHELYSNSLKQISTLRDEVVQLKDTMQNTESATVATLKADNESLKASVKEHEQAMDELQDVLGVVKDENNALKAELEECKGCVGWHRELLAEIAQDMGYKTPAEVDALSKGEDESAPMVIVRLVRKERDQLRAHVSQLEGALPFCRKVIECSRDGGDADGGDIQDWAVEAGLIVPTEVTSPCGEPEACRCCEHDNIPGTCYKDSDMLISDIAALAGGGEKKGSFHGHPSGAITPPRPQEQEKRPDDTLDRLASAIDDDTRALVDKFGIDAVAVDIATAQMLRRIVDRARRSG